MKTLNPDTLVPASGEELRERQVRTGELGDGKTVVCFPDPADQQVVQQVPRSTCLRTPYAACLSCPHHNFEYIFSIPTQEDWVLCPRWNREAGTGPPSYYVPVWLSECRATPHPFCRQCPGREELAQLLTDKQRTGWLERYRKLTREDDGD
jgi:hypothetical protein